MEYNSPHIPVLLAETIEGLDIKEGGTYVDCTCGFGGHSSEILKRLGKNGKLIGFDKDEQAVEFVCKRFAGDDRFSIIKEDFKNAPEVLDEMGIKNIDGVLMDLGVSSLQLDQADRGFSYVNDGKLDMRMSKSQSFSAYDVVNSYSEEDLANVIYEYGEDRLSRRIARKIVEERKKSPIETTGELAKIVIGAYPKESRYKFGNPAKRTFQAIRIEVNGELEGLGEAVENMTKRLNEGGRICVISFHSLEDRIIKRKFEYLAKDCICPPEAPVCICNKKPEIVILTKKPIVASEEELEYNRRSESAKLRIAKKI